MHGMDGVEDSQVAKLPIACTLGSNDGAARMQRWAALSETDRPHVRRSGHLLEVRYEPKVGVREKLEALAADERRCCSFVAWEVIQDPDHVVLRITADPVTPDAVAPIAALFGAG